MGYIPKLIKTTDLDADLITGAKLADDALDSEHYADGSIDTAHIADDQITLAKMAAGTDGNIISFDASGNPVAIATGNDGQVLTSSGAGQPPAFETAAGGGVDTTGTPADNQVAIFTDADTLEGDSGLTFGSGGDLIMTTNTSETQWIVNTGTARDLATYGYAYIFPGNSGSVNANQALYGGEGGYAGFGLLADQGDDAGDGWTFFAMVDNDLDIYNNNNEPAAILQWEGLLQLDSTLSQNAWDYAEFFEWKTELADDDEEEAMLGMTVVLDGDKVRLAEPGEEDDILGVVRPNGTATTCNERIKWQAKYLKDVWGRFIYEEFTRTTWNEPDKSHRHSYPSDQIPAYRLKKDFSQDQPEWWLNEDNFEKDRDGEFIPVVVPETDEEKEATDFLVRDYHRGSGKPLKRRIFNPEFDQSREYEQRQDRRKEWAIVGLMGQVIIRQNAVIPSRYRFMTWAQEATGEGTDDYVPGLGHYFIK